MAQALIAGHPPLQSKIERPLSLDPESFPMPVGREEEWRFTPLAAITSLLDGSAVDDGGVKTVVRAPHSVDVGRIDRNDSRVARHWVPDEKGAALALQRTANPLLISIPKETVVSETIEVDVSGLGGVGYDHLVIDVAPFASATVVIHHSGSGHYSGNIETVLGEGSSLTLVSLQEWDDEAIHLGHHPVYVGRDARFRSFTISLGGRVVRLNPTVTYGGPGGDAELFGIFFADDHQHLEHRVLVDHATSHCRSRVTYKGALQGEGAHSVWIGDVVIRSAAVGTDTYELNRNLVLTDGARADSVPNLEIETGEIVGAGHASATGRFDESAMFYLQSRGIPPEEAMKLVVRGFFAEVIDQLHIPYLIARLTNAIDGELSGVAL